MVFVVIDGLDASGKSTHARLLCNFLLQSKHTVFLRIHPSSDNYFGVKAKEFLYVRGKGAHLAAAWFYMLDVIRSILLYSWRKYDYIVFARYLMGTAYLPSPLDRLAYHFFASTVPMSNKMFFLDVASDEAYRRIKRTRRQLERFEGLDELKQIRRKALSLALLGNWIIVDSGRPVEKVEAELQQRLL